MADPRLLLSNDDGHQSGGFAVLERVARELSSDVWLCAPETEQSATSHSLTIHRPLRLRELAERRYGVDGTPTDCVLLAINHILAAHKPDFVLSGVNHGSNIAEDITYSGTIAAAMEATLLGVPAMAFSQDLSDDHPLDWSVAERWGPIVARRLMAVSPWPASVLMNVNFPAVPVDAVKGVAVVPHMNRKVGDHLDERLDPRGRRYFWIGTARNEDPLPENSDSKALHDGYVTVTPIHLDLTHYPTMAMVREALGSVEAEPA